MTDELTNYLMQGTARHASISPEQLELMGKQAANMYLDERVALNEGVAKIAAEHPDINREQVKRVSEFANTAVYLALHDKNKTSGANSSYPQFELADPARIIQDMSDGARPTVVTHIDADYGRQPEKPKLSSVRTDALLEEMFHVKTASDFLDFSEDTAIGEVMNAKASLTALRETLSSSGEQIDLAHKQASAEHYELVKRHLLDGGDFSEIMAAAKSTGASDEKIASAMKPVLVRLMSEKVASVSELQKGVRGLSKVAHRKVNDEHPLVVSFGAVLSLGEEIEKVAAGLSEVDAELQNVNAFIRENFLAGTPR